MGKDEDVTQFGDIYRELCEYLDLGYPDEANDFAHALHTEYCYECKRFENVKNNARLFVSLHGMEDYKLRFSALYVAANHAYESEVEQAGMAGMIEQERDEWVAARVEEWIEEAAESATE